MSKAIQFDGFDGKRRSPLLRKPNTGCFRASFIDVLVLSTESKWMGIVGSVPFSAHPFPHSLPIACCAKSALFDCKLCTNRAVGGCVHPPAREPAMVVSNCFCFVYAYLKASTGISWMLTFRVVGGREQNVAYALYCNPTLIRVGVFGNLRKQSVSFGNCHFEGERAREL